MSIALLHLNVKDIHCDYNGIRTQAIIMFGGNTHGKTICNVSALIYEAEWPNFLLKELHEWNQNQNEIKTKFQRWFHRGHQTIIGLQVMW